MFSNTQVDTNIKDFHAFGCPVYALDSKLAGGQSIGHWNPRARIGINLGFSPRHAQNVYNVLNVNTATVSPQFHVKLDDFFESVSAGAGNAPVTTICQTVAGFTKDKPAGTVPNTMPLPQTPQRFSLTPNMLVPRENNDFLPSDTADTPDAQPVTERNELTDSEQPAERVGNSATPSFSREPAPSPDPTGDDSTIRRSKRQHKPTQRLLERVDMGLMEGFAFTIDDEPYYDALHEDDYAIQDAMKDPVAFMGKQDDTVYYHQAMAEPDKRKFQDAMLKEFNDHSKRNHWKPVLLSTLPFGTKILDSIWAMKRKRDILTQQIIKWKARLNVHGGKKEHGVHYWETYAPVVNWFSIRLLLSQALLNNWHTRQVDFVIAYPQAEPECEMYMKLPKGIAIPGLSNETHTLKLLQNLYGGKAARRIWIQYLTTGLTNMGFTQSKVDKCVWYRGDIIFTFYVDDGIIWCPRA